MDMEFMEFLRNEFDKWWKSEGLERGKNLAALADSVVWELVKEVSWCAWREAFVSGMEESTCQRLPRDW